MTFIYRHFVAFRFWTWSFCLVFCVHHFYGMHTQCTDTTRYTCSVHSHFNRLRFIVVWLVGRSIGWLSFITLLECAHIRVQVHKMQCTSWCAFDRMRLMFKFMFYVHIHNPFSVVLVGSPSMEWTAQQPQPHTHNRNLFRRPKANIFYNEKKSNSNETLDLCIVWKCTIKWRPLPSPQQQ